MIPEVLSKITEIRRMIEQKGRPVELEVDGGIKVDNIGVVARGGSGCFCERFGDFRDARIMRKPSPAMRKNISPQRTQRSQRRDL